MQSLCVNGKQTVLCLYVQRLIHCNEMGVLNAEVQKLGGKMKQANYSGHVMLMCLNNWEQISHEKECVLQQLDVVDKRNNLIYIDR